jgi:hypothetical protein
MTDGLDFQAQVTGKMTFKITTRTKQMIIGTNNMNKLKGIIGLLLVILLPACTATTTKQKYSADLAAKWLNGEDISNMPETGSVIIHSTN